jgi:hypothetical protein
LAGDVDDDDPVDDDYPTTLMMMMVMMMMVMMASDGRNHDGNHVEEYEEYDVGDEGKVRMRYEEGEGACDKRESEATLHSTTK